ncbi:MAG: hypothetical protein ACRC9V_12505, partial [Aeromonas sp.]
CHEAILAQQEIQIAKHSQLLSDITSSICQICDRLPSSPTASPVVNPVSTFNPQVQVPHVELRLPPPQLFTEDPSACKDLLPNAP